jgi:hypothetical protein
MKPGSISKIEGRKNVVKSSVLRGAAKAAAMQARGVLSENAAQNGTRFRGRTFVSLHVVAPGSNSNVQIRRDLWYWRVHPRQYTVTKRLLGNFV